jgi:hypothetical protein
VPGSSPSTTTSAKWWPATSKVPAVRLSTSTVAGSSTSTQMVAWVSPT